MAANKVTFEVDKVTTLHIPHRVRLKTENARILVRIIKKHKRNKYSLMCEFGWIQSSFHYHELNQLNVVMQAEYAHEIPIVILVVD